MMLFLSALMLVLTARADSPQARSSQNMTGHFTGSVQTGFWNTMGALFRLDNTYCGTPNGSSPCPYVGAAPTGVYVGDAESIAKAFVLNDRTIWPQDLFHEIRDYEELFGIRKGESIFSVGPQDISVTMGLEIGFDGMDSSQQAFVKKFYSQMDDKASRFSVALTGPQGQKGFFPLSRYPNIFLRDKSSAVSDENHRPLEEGWLWKAALDFSGKDPVQAMKLLAYCGADRGFSPQFKDESNRFSCPQQPWMWMVKALPADASISEALESQVYQAHQETGNGVPPGEKLPYVDAKNYHVFAAAYIGCELTARGHRIDQIIRVEKALASAYRDFTFRHQVCEDAHSPAGNGHPSNAKDDAVYLMQQLKRDDSRGLSVELDSIQNKQNWNSDRFGKAKAQVKEWLLDWEWTKAQHEAGARWGAEVCRKK